MPKPAPVFLSAIALAALGTVSLVSVFGSVVAANADSQSCTISPDNAGCQMHRPVELEQQADGVEQMWEAPSDRQESGDRTATETANRRENRSVAESQADDAADPEEGRLAEIFDR